MSVARIKNWVAEILTYADLNAEFDNLAVNIPVLASQTDANLMVETTKALTPNNNKIILGTQQVVSSVTAITFSSIPAGVRKIHIMFSGVSSNATGSSNVIIRIGDSGGVETSSYLGSATTITSATPATANFTTGFGVLATAIASMLLHGTATLTLENNSAFTWSCTSILGHSNAATISIGAGVKSLSAELDRVVITTVNGTDALSGTINISYER